MDAEPKPFDWPHAPIHRLSASGAYIVTCGTYNKLPLFRDADRLTYLTKALIVLARERNWRLQAWSVFANHYHFVAEAESGSSLVSLVRYLNSISAKYVNRLDDAPGRKVWHQYWDTHLTYHPSFLARLNYVHTNPVKHGVVSNAELYEWCSASWFARTAQRSFFSTVMGLRSDNIALPDDYDLTEKG